MSLPPIKSPNKGSLKLKNSPKGLNLSPSIARSKAELIVKSERGSQKRVIKSELSLPKLILKK